MKCKDNRSRGEKNKSKAVDAFSDRVMKAMRLAVKDAVAKHHATGAGVPISRGGEIVMLMPDGTTQPLKKRKRSERAA